MTTTNTIQPWIRRTNYFQDYFSTAYDFFIREYPAYFITYYSVDVENTIWDDDVIYGGSYEKNGIGTLSGVKFKKIFMFPVFGMEEINPTQDSDEEGGITYSKSMPTVIAFPSVYGVKPLELDIVDLNFGFKSPSIKIDPLFVVSGINLAHSGQDYQLYQVQLKVAPYKVPDVEKQISSYWMYMDKEKKIYPYDKAKSLINLQERAGSLATNLSTIYNNKTGFFLQES